MRLLAAAHASSSRFNPYLPPPTPPPPKHHQTANHPQVLAPHREMGPIAALAAGRDHALLLTAGSDPWVAAWGRNRLRQVGEAGSVSERCVCVCVCVRMVCMSVQPSFLSLHPPTHTHPHPPPPPPPHTKAHYACPAADAKGDLLQPTLLPLLLDPGIDSTAVVRGVVAGYDSSGVVVEEVGGCGGGDGDACLLSFV